MFNINIIKTHRNYFTCKLLPDCLSSKVALHKLVAAMFGDKLFGGSVINGSAAPMFIP